MEERNLRTHPSRMRCPQCGGLHFLETGQLFALTPMTKTADGQTRLHTEDAVPVLNYLCRQCGHILLYSAKHLKRI